ncbi:MT organizer Mto2 [Schizosaccharomyces japonicus yFS275]|uniref:MT organizer Mto2 n=1 Tax=Schizosaccharomyces japonicus (strain yFS275 / FY16936) TaxID=402676 RepID=B6K3S3_SCHJY|nr:MT organizer Mto2 [Schizosaccharomyces japonicus yFS275]EEB08130.1 MT organizer Mto2 [Schizosaccharomyces japonicus yFS275]
MSRLSFSPKKQLDADPFLDYEASTGLSERSHRTVGSFLHDSVSENVNEEPRTPFFGPNSSSFQAQSIFSPNSTFQGKSQQNLRPSSQRRGKFLFQHARSETTNVYGRFASSSPTRPRQLDLALTMNDNNSDTALERATQQLSLTSPQPQVRSRELEHTVPNPATNEFIFRELRSLRERLGQVEAELARTRMEATTTLTRASLSSPVPAQKLQLALQRLASHHPPDDVLKPLERAARNALLLTQTSPGPTVDALCRSLTETCLGLVQECLNARMLADESQTPRLPGPNGEEEMSGYATITAASTGESGRNSYSFPVPTTAFTAPTLTNTNNNNNSNNEGLGRFSNAHTIMTTPRSQRIIPPTSSPLSDRVKTPVLRDRDGDQMPASSRFQSKISLSPNRELRASPVSPRSPPFHRKRFSKTASSNVLVTPANAYAQPPTHSAQSSPTRFSLIDKVLSGHRDSLS